MVLVADIGYGHTKYAYKDKVYKFPTSIAMAMAGDFGEAAVVNFNSKDYLVGNDAQYALSTIPTRTDDFLLNYTPIILGKIFLKEEKIDIDTVCLSLSIIEYKRKKDKLIQKCKQFVINNYVYSQKIKVFPQGVGIWIDSGSPQNAIIIDIGFNTVDVVSFLDSKPRAEYSFGLLDMGACIITDAISNYVNKKFQGIHLTPHDANNILLNKGKFKVFRHEYDISDYINTLKENYAETIFGTVLSSTIIKGILEKVDSLILAGGGAYFIDDNNPIKEKYNIQIPYEPEFANVRGFLQLAQGGK